MGWSGLATQFCLEIGFGVLLALAFVPKAPVGPLFYRILGTAGFLPVFVAAGASVLWGGREWTSSEVLCAVVAAAGYPAISAPVRGGRWALSLAWSLSWCAAAIALTVGRVPAVLGAGDAMLGTFSAMATGAVAGSVGVSMVLGHWYLTVPTLKVGHLRRLNRLSVAAMLCNLAALAATVASAGGDLRADETPLLGPWGLFHLGTRVAVGLLFPLAFAWMSASSLRYGNTRSATGILYASTVLVLIGAAVSISLQDSYGVPL